MSDYSQMLDRAKQQVKVLWPQMGKPPSEEMINIVASIATVFARKEVSRFKNDLRSAGGVTPEMYKQALMQVLAERTGFEITSPEVEAAADRIVGNV